MAATRTPASSFAHEQGSAVALARAMAEGRATSERIVRDCLARIEAIDRHGPRLRSVIELNPEAIAIAKALDGERKAGRVRGPLHGVPVLLKDNIATGDRMSTTAGSLALDGVRAPRDAHIVKRLRDAGAVILGKTNLSEWANIRSTRSIERLERARRPDAQPVRARSQHQRIELGLGRGGRGEPGAARRRHRDRRLDRLAGVDLRPRRPQAHRRPASAATASCRSRHARTPPGPMTRTVADAALLSPRSPDRRGRRRDLGGPGRAGAGHDLASRRRTARRPPRHRARLLHRLRRARRPDRAGDRRPEARGRGDRRSRRPAAADVSDAELRVLLYELKASLPRHLATFAPGATVKTLADAIAFNRSHREREMPWFGQELFEKAEAYGGLDSQEYLDALAECRKGARDDGIDRVMKSHRLDALIAPTGGPAWLIDPVNGDHSGASFSSPAAVAGYPHLTVPAGFVRGLPVGISFVGPAWSEARLLALGNAYEKATRRRREPTYARITTPSGS